MRIRITDVPPGEAPEDVRRAWIGIELTVIGRRGKPITAHTVGVLTGPRFRWLTALWTILAGKTTKERGYAVASAHAFERLADHAPEAERWWKENTPDLYRQREMLMFSEDACTPIDAEGDTG